MIIHKAIKNIIYLKNQCYLLNNQKYKIIKNLK